MNIYVTGGCVDCSFDVRVLHFSLPRKTALIKMFCFQLSNDQPVCVSISFFLSICVFLFRLQVSWTGHVMLIVQNSLGSPKNVTIKPKVNNVRAIADKWWDTWMNELVNNVIWPMRGAFLTFYIHHNTTQQNIT